MLVSKIPPTRKLRRRRWSATGLPLSRPLPHCLRKVLFPSTPPHGNLGAGAGQPLACHCQGHRPIGTPLLSERFVASNCPRWPHAHDNRG
eukprot:7236833-Alexandrium_andersonii.AAC.1